jgi:sugar lactone lactonase YvrE
MILTSGSSVNLFDLDTGDLDTLATIQIEETNSNDGVVDRQGRFVFGLSDLRLVGQDASDDVAPRGGWFRVDPDMSLHQIATGVGVTNGPCFSPDGTLLYASDSWKREVQVYDYDHATGSVSNRRSLASISTPAWEGSGSLSTRPDGATIDEQGGVWVAVVYGGELVRYTPDGSVDRRVAFPVANPTSVTFGGPDLDILFVTTMHSYRPDAPAGRASGLAGGIFAIRGLGVKGVPEPRFAG